MSVGLGERIEGAVENSWSDEALFLDHVGDGFDGFMTFEELRTHLYGLVDFSPDLEVEGKREEFSSPTEMP